MAELIPIKSVRTILYIAEAIAFVSAVYSFRKTLPKHHKALAFYFLFIVFAEFIGRYLHQQRLLDYTRIWYGYIVIPIEFFFFYWFLFRHFSEQKDKRMVKGGSVLFALSLIVEWVFFYNTEAVFISLSYTFGNLLLLIFIMLYFNRLIHSKRILNFNRELEFWICAGLLLFYLCTFPFFGLYNYFLDNFPTEFRTYYMLMLWLNISMYLIFSTGMLWTKSR